MGQLVLKRASASRSSGEWSDDDYDVLADGMVVGRIMKAAAAPVGMPWLWTLAFGHLMLAIVILYGITKDRWPWRRIILGIARTLAWFALAAIVIMAAIVIEQSWRR